MPGKTDVISALKHQQQERHYQNTTTFSIETLKGGMKNMFIHIYCAQN